MATKITTAAHYATEDDRRKNIDTVKGLIQACFVAKEPSDLTHGPGLALDFENSLRRSRTESSRYEMKQGFLRLDKDRGFDDGLVERLAQTLCAMANVGPGSPGFVHIGVAEKVADAERIGSLDAVSPIEMGSCWIVGVEREATILKKTLDDYVKMVGQKLRASAMSEPLKSDVLARMDSITYKGFTVIRLMIPPQKGASYVGEKCYVREGSESKEIRGPQIESVVRRFKE